MSIPVFPYRNTYITVNEFVPECQQPLVLMEKMAGDMAILGGDDARDRVLFVQDIGWQQQSYQRMPSNVHEASAGQSGILTVASGALTVAASHNEIDVFAQANLTGVTYSGSPTTGSPMVRKGIEAGDSWNQALSADQTAFPSPVTSEDPVNMDRVAKTAANHDPDETIQVRLEFPGHVAEVKGPLATIYFSGPAGSDKNGIGVGQYALKLFGTGLAHLYERASVDGGALGWVHRWKWQWARPESILNTTHYITISSDCTTLDGSGYRGSRLAFFANRQGNDWGVVSTLAQTAIDAIKLSTPGNVPLFRVPQLTKEYTTVAPFRLDVRRDVRAYFQIAKDVYPATGTLVDDVWSLEFAPFGDVTTTFEWYAKCPSDSSIDCRLYRADTNAEVTSTLSISDEFGGQRTCVLPDGVTQYYFVFTWTASTDRDRTATLLTWRVIRPEVAEVPDVVSEELQLRESGGDLVSAAIADVSIQGPSIEANDEAATFTLHDLLANYKDLGGQGSVPVKIETSYDINDSRSVLFRGYAEQIQVRSIVEHSGYGYPKAGYRTYSFQCVGQWLRVQEGLAPTSWTWVERDTNQPYKVTDAIYYELKRVGVPDEMLDIPDLEVRFFFTQDNAVRTESGSPVADVIKGWARDYLGGWIIYDGNCGDYGKIRLVLPKSPPYNVVARFDTRHPGNGKLPHVSGSYGSTTVGSQVIQHTYVRGETLTWHIERPEGNLVTVYGAGFSSDEGGSTVMLSQRMANFRSYNFAGLDPSDPNYPRPTLDNWDHLGRVVPIRVYDGSLANQMAVDWVCRRVFNYACHGQRVLRFEAPLLLVTDADDAEQTAPRALRFYDVVEFYDLDEGAWVEYLVRRCDPSYEKDGFQFAQYELVRSTVMDDYAAMSIARIEDVYRAVMRIFQIGNGDSARTQRQTQAQGDIARSKTRWHSLPETYSPEIQDTDPASPSFGAGIFVWGLDSVGSSEKVIGGAA